MQRKLRVLIADDEKKICELIVKLIDWNALGFTVIGFAHNGLQAYEIALRDKPDVIITDIRMPAMTGLELVKKLQNNEHHMRFIMISGYKEFEYAKSAIRFGATDYLLKPINADELSASLIRIHGELQLMSESEHVSVNQSENNRPASLPRQQFIYGLLSNEVNLKDITLSRLNIDYQYHFEERPLGLFIVKVDCLKIENLSMRPFVLDKMVQVLKRASKYCCSDFEIITIYSRLYCLFQCNSSERTFDIFVEQLSRVADRYDTYTFTICLGSEASEPNCLGRTIQLAQRASLYRLLGSANHIVDSALLPAEQQATGTLQNSERIELLNAVEHGEKSSLRLLLQQLFDEYMFATKNEDNLESMYERYQDIIISVQQGYPETDEIMSGLSDISSIYEAIDNAISVPQFISTFINAFLNWVEPAMEYLRQQHTRPIRKAAAYMEEHYTQSITLEDAAMVAGMSPSYFSSVFKKEMGENFSDYLTSLRMRQAKRLLRDTIFSIEQISEMIGYNDYRYFSKLFKRTYAISPGKYRKL
ncbi:MAG: response regulator [Christensenellales bacterium]|jgi:two-component system response regulator YesN